MRTVHKRRRDPQRAYPAAECALCGGAVYRGEVCRRVWGRVLCGDCAGSWLPREFPGFRMRPGEVGR